MSVILYGLLPLLVFVVVDIYAGMRWAVGSAAAFAVFDIFLTKYSLGIWDPGSFVALGLILALGAYSVRTKNPLYFKLQPTIIAAIFALMLIYFQFFGTPIGERYGDLVTKQIPEQYKGMFTPDVTALMLNRIGIAGIIVFVIHGTMCAFAALKLSNWAWLGVRTVGFWVLAVVVGIVVGLLTGASIPLHG